MNFVIGGGVVPDKVVSWIYNSNLPRQHRDIAFFGIKPNFNQVIQPYKNPNDKRIKNSNNEGARLYDWWEIQQIKNVSKGKTNHPCQMPQKVMDNIVGILPKGKFETIIDPFCGSGTTGLSALKYGYNFVGIDIDKNYIKIAEERIAKMQLSLFV